MRIIINTIERNQMRGIGATDGVYAGPQILKIIEDLNRVSGCDETAMVTESASYDLGCRIEAATADLAPDELVWFLCDES